jgi:uncharacterized protein YdeI (YjbR/CyaY-like superfamily)
MAPPLEVLEVKDRRGWRAWLAKHHTSSPGIWLVFHKAHTGAKAMSIDDMVREALCFGWIDSLVKRLDEDRYEIKVTPRKATSNWSDLNRQRWKELESAGLLAPAGLSAAPTENRYAPRPNVPELPPYIAKAIRSNADAWEFFQKLPPRERRNFVVWIHMAKRPETRTRRIAESIALLAEGKKLGLK